MTTRNPFFTIFVPTGNRCKSLARTLSALTRQTYDNFEVIIVAFKSSDNTQGVIDEYRKKLRIISIPQKQGLSVAANQALEIANGEVFVRTDDDVVMSPQWLEALSRSFNSSSQVGGVTGPTIIPEEYIKSRDLFYFEEKFKKGNLFFRLLGKIYFNYFLEGEPYRVSHWYKCGTFSLGSNFKDSLKEPIQDVNNLEACNFAVRTELLKKIGGFDSVTFTGIGEYHEPDAAFKIQKMGYKLLFNPKAMVNHCPSQDGFYKDRPSSYSRMINFILFYFRHIKITSFDKFVRFFSYLLFLNLFYFYQFIKKKQINQLGAIPATLVGLVKVLAGKHLQKEVQFS